MPAPTRSTMVKVVAGTIVLALVFMLLRGVFTTSTSRTTQRQVAEQLQAATRQRDAGHYQEAWMALQQGASIDPDRDDVRRVQEDVAMEWLRRVGAAEGAQSFRDIVGQVQPLLIRGIAESSGPRKADLAAHLGWADYLLWREGQRELRPDEQYRRALVEDSTNPFAHAMWAHWILWQHGSPQDAREHFVSAVESGRERDYVRGLQVAALSDQHTDVAGVELMHIADEMRASGEPIVEATRRRLAEGICLDSASRLRLPTRSHTPPPPAVSPDADLLTIAWIFDNVRLGDGEHAIRDYCMASVEEMAGKQAIALATYRSVRDRLPKVSPLRGETDARIRRLAKGSSSD